MSYKEFYNDLNKGLTGNTLFFYGEEYFLIKWAIDKLISENIEPENRDIDVIEYSGDDYSIGDVISTAMTYSMFSEKRIVLVRNYPALYKKAEGEDQKAAGEKIKALFSDPPETSIVIFYLDSMYTGRMTALAKSLSKLKGAYSFDRLDKPELGQFIKKRINNSGKYISDRNLRYMMDVTGYYNRDSEYSLAEMENDLAKLVNATDTDEIEASYIDDIMMGDDEKFIFDLVSAMEKNNKNRAMELTINILRRDDGNPMALIGFMTKQFEIMYDSLEMESRGVPMREMAGRVGVSEGRIRNAYRAAAKIGMPKMRTMLMDLYDIDKGIKTGNIDGETAIELFVLGSVS